MSLHVLNVRCCRRSEKKCNAEWLSSRRGRGKEMATQTKDYYSVLGIKKTATADDIRKAFRKAARKYHPDVNPGDKKAEERFKEISEANDVLSDDKKRKIYDQLGFYSDSIDPAAAEAAARGGYGGAGFGGAQAG